MLPRIKSLCHSGWLTKVNQRSVRVPPVAWAVRTACGFYRGWRHSRSLGCTVAPGTHRGWITATRLRLYPFNTGYLPLNYSGNPGVNGVSYRGRLTQVNEDQFLGIMSRKKGLAEPAAVSHTCVCKVRYRYNGLCFLCEIDWMYY